MDRKRFIQKTSAGILLGIPALMMLSCSASDDGSELKPNPDPDPNPGAGNCLENGTDTAISANHGHSLTVSKADVEAGNEKTYTLTEGNSHTHEITISQSQFASLKDNSSVSATSTTDSGHTHKVTVSCA